MGRPRLYATSVERKAAWRRRQGMTVRLHYPSAAAKQAAYRARKQAARALAARECATIQQALRTRALADQSWELHERIDTWSRDADMPRRVPADRPPDLLAGASVHLYGIAAARVRQHRQALQRLAYIRATRGAQAGMPRDAGQRATAVREDDADAPQGRHPIESAGARRYWRVNVTVPVSTRGQSPAAYVP